MAPSTNSPRSYGIVLFPQFEVLDAAGPLEILNMLAFLSQNDEMKLSVIAQTLDPVNPGPIAPATLSANFNGQQHYLPTHTFDTAPPLDVLIVPGGRGTRASNEDLKPLLDFLRTTYHGREGVKPLQYIFSICTGSLLLAKAGLLTGHRATSNKKAWDLVTRSPESGQTHWVAKARWVVSGNVWTTSGVSAGIDGMVALVGEVYGEGTAGKVCDAVEHSRVRDAGDDPFAEMNGCRDVLPVG